MLRKVKIATLHFLKNVGVFEWVARSSWRQKRLLILCFHGISLEDEHLWRPALYMQPERLKEHLELLKQSRCSVLPLGEALQRLRDGALPPRSVAITFDDGTYDFYRHARPLLSQYGYPATVYLTTYYTSFELPVFSLICSYMLWKRRGTVLESGAEIGLNGPLDLRTESARHDIVLRLVEMAARENMSGRQQDAVAARLAHFLNLDFNEIKSKRILQLMNPREVEEIAQSGIDVQLHTHRHRTPENEELFRREIQDNRKRIQELISKDAVHFCYPSGVHRPSFLSWLEQERVVSATTCDVGLATQQSESLLLPRFIDNQSRTSIDFESWITGVGDLLAVRRAARQRYIPQDH